MIEVGRGLALAAFGCLVGCGKDAAPAGGAATEPSPSAPPVASSVGSSTPAPAASSADLDAPPAAPPALAEILPRCCTVDRAEGHFGVPTAVHTAFVGDFLRKKDGKRLLFPDDLISDTKELFQHARSAGKTVKQERKLRVVGETDRTISVEVLDSGATGSMVPFSHSACKTVSLRDGRALKLEDAVGKDAALAVVVKARIQFDERNRGDVYRFVERSFALVDEGSRLRFCNPPKDTALGAQRLDVEVAVPR